MEELNLSSISKASQESSLEKTKRINIMPDHVKYPKLEINDSKIRSNGIKKK